MKKKISSISILIVLMMIMMNTSTWGQGNETILIDDFEGENGWWSYEAGSEFFHCEVTQSGYESEGALEINFDIGQSGAPGCGFDYFLADANWTAADGFSFMWRADLSYMLMQIIVSVEDPTQTNPEAEGVTDFEAFILTERDTWSQAEVAWDMFEKSDWVGDSGIETINPSQIVTILFSVAEWERGTIWIDDLSVIVNSGNPVAGQDNSLPSLDEVERWFYYLDVNLETEVVEQISESTYDMVVIDFITSEANNTDYPIAEVVEQFHTAEHPKLVLAYIDIGQAESYRTYWQDEWQVGSPEWITGKDPDGWEDNYPVAFWYDDYQNIWLGENGYLQTILDAGFDGVYLDWVEAYSDENVIALAETEGLDTAQEMIWWVEDIAAFGRTQNPNFIVIGQNAAELVVYPEYLEIIDAISQEQVWFDGAADNNPPGDCPLPQSETDVETEDYIATLSEPCLQLYEEQPDSTLHVSSESYLDYLIPAQEIGMIIFTVDYAVDTENITWIYETSRSLGFIPFVSNRALNQFINPVP